MLHLADDKTQDRIDCFLNPNFPEWEIARPERIAQGILYLKDLKGPRATCRVNAGKCVRLSCSYQSAIWLCSDVSSAFVDHGSMC